MRLPTRIWAGLYGVLFHVVVLLATLWTSLKSGAEIPSSFWWTAAVPFLASAFAVYAVLVGPYVPKRPTHRGAALFDSAIGMAAELCVVALTAVLYAVAVSGDAAAGGVGAYLGAVANRTLFGFLWALGGFFVQILVVGNAAGLVGWVVLKRLSARRAAAQGQG